MIIIIIIVLCLFLVFLFFVSLKGDWVQGLRQGYGTMRYPSGNTYEGEWFADKVKVTEFNLLVILFLFFFKVT